MNYLRPKEFRLSDMGVVERMEPYELIREIAGYRYVGVQILLGWLFVEQSRIRPPLSAMKWALKDLINREGVPLPCWQRASDYLLLYRGVE
jgi:hypothetical protein